MAHNNSDSFSETPLYNIGAVERMTGIPPATLRVWERRYDFPNPERTSGGHRIYTEREVERLKWVKERIDAGMQTSQAVEALQTLEKEGAFPERRTLLAASPPSAKRENPALATLQTDLTEVLLSTQIAKADQILGETLALYPIEDLILHIIRPTLREIGDSWLNGEISIAEEHLATHYLRHRLIMWLETGPPPHSVPPTVLACAPGEWHEGSLLMLGVLLRRRRWPVTYLGQSLPLKDMAEFVKDVNTPAVVLVAMRTETAQALAGWPKWLPEALETGRPIVTYGGRIFTNEPEWRARVPGIFLGETLTEGVETLERLLKRKHAIS